MFLRLSSSKLNKNKPLACSGGLSFKGLLKSPLRVLLKPFISSFLLCFVLLVSIDAFSALRIKHSEPAPPTPLQLSYDGGIFLTPDVEVIRYEKIGFFRYDPSAGQNFTVNQSFLADQDSLDYENSLSPLDPPTAFYSPLLTSMPNPIDLDGNPLALGGALPLAEATDFNFSATEPLFIVAEGPYFSDSRAVSALNYIGVTVALDNGDEFIVTLTESSPGVYVGYLQPNVLGSPVTIPPNSVVSIDFDNSDESFFVTDADTENAPWLIDPLVVDSVRGRKTGTFGASPAVDPDFDLFLSKQSLRSSATLGDFIAYDLRLENTSNVSISGVMINDTLPKGFRYQKNSTSINGERVSDPSVSPDGIQLAFSMPDLASAEVVTLRYVVEISAAADQGKAINTAQASNGTVDSNVSTASVLVENPFFNDRAFLLGRVLAGSCGSEDAVPLEGIRIYLEDGTNVMTDQFGRWHMEGVMPGTHVIQLDESTLGARYVLQQCQDNTRKAGNPASRFVNVQGGTLWREDWYLGKVWGTEANVEQQLTSTQLPDGRVQIELPVRMGERLYDEVMTQITMPEHLAVVPGTTTIDGRLAADLQKREGVYEISLAPEGYFAKYSLGFVLEVDPNVPESAETLVTAETVAITQKGTMYSVKSENLLGVKGFDKNDNNIVLRPKFPPMSPDLSDEDVASFVPVIEKLKGIENLYLDVVGHSDSVPIRYRPGRRFNNNYSLSEARAQSVAAYLTEVLQLDPSRVTAKGVGADEPIADNRTREGRAENRRVEISFRFTERVGDSSVEVLDGYSGINTDLDQPSYGVSQNTSDSTRNNSVDKAGFTSLKEGDTLIHSVFSATALMDENLKVELSINGKQVPAGKIGMKMIDEATGMVRYTWVGLELDQVGDHFISLRGIGPFGNARFEQNLNVRLSGTIKTIRLADAGQNMADGKTPIKVKLKLLDQSDKEVVANTELELVSGNLIPLNSSQNPNPLEQRSNVIHVDSLGYARFEPVGTAGTYQLRIAASDGVYEDIEIPVSPDLREWILVGFAEGSIGYNTLKGNMSALKAEEDHAYADGNAAFFARGKVKGEWLLTMAYDNRREEGDNPLMQRIDPQAWYVLYGDDTTRNHDAPTSTKLYLRIEKTDFYALFGDYDTGLTMTELSRFQRTVTGAKSEWKSDTASALGFITQTDQGFVRDDIAADGTSGLYRLSRNGVVPGSEKVSIEVRDRFTNEVIRTEPMTPFADYNLDNDDGTLYFRRPVFPQDEEFNPQRIVVEYEVDAESNEFIAGGRVALHDKQKEIEVGLSVVDDSTVGADGTLGGVDVTWKPNDAHTVKAELASTRQSDINNVSESSQAGLAEYKYTSEKFDSRVKVEEVDGQFGLGNLASDDDDIRKAEAETRYRFSEEVVLSASASNQEILSNGNERTTAETRFEYLQPDWSSYSGFRHAQDSVGSNEFESQHLIAGGRKAFLNKRLIMSAQGEARVDHNENADYTNLLGLGSDYRVNNSVSLFAGQNFSWGEERRSQEAKAGVRSTPWKGGTVTTDVSRAQDEFGPRVLAHAGLFQVVKLSDRWSADFGFDRSQTIRDDSSNESDSFDPRRNLANGGRTAGNTSLTSGNRNSDYTAISAGTGYRTAEWQWTNRAELRRSDINDKWSFLSGFHHRLDAADTVAGRLLHFDTRNHGGLDERSTELDFSFARRPQSDALYWLNRTRLITDELGSGSDTLKGQRVINNTHLNFLPAIGHQVSLQYSGRYVRETIDQQRFKGYTDLIGAEYRYDITSKWDLGLRGSTLASWNSDIRINSFGVMGGYSPVRDVWISLGYNFKGFYDRDFDDAETRVQGFVLNFRIKLDQENAPELVDKTRDWIQRK